MWLPRPRPAKVIVIVTVALLGLGLLALIMDGTITRSTKGSATATILNESQSSKTTILSGNNSNSFHLGVDIIPNARLVPLGGSANFTLFLYGVSDLTGGLSLSAAPPSGLTLRFGQVSVSKSGAGPLSSVLQVNSSREMSPGTYLVTIMATGSKGMANQTIDFHVQRNLVLLSSSNLHQFTNLTLKVGDDVTWVALDGPFGDVKNGWHEVVFSNSTVRSGWIIAPPWGSNPQWSYIFNHPGIYRYYDDAFPTITGEITVLP